MIAIIGAMNEEVNELLTYFPKAKANELKGISFYQDEFILIAKSGVGKVDAAYTVTTLLNHFDISFVINIGSAGGLKSSQKVGDIVIANRLSYHDFILDIKQEHFGGLRHSYYPLQDDIDLAKEVCEQLDLRFHVGWGLSGDRFITSDYANHLITHFPEVMFCDMESTAIAHVCTKHQTPYLILRGLSDITTNKDNQLTFEQYLVEASKVSAKLTVQFINKRRDLGV